MTLLGAAASAATRAQEGRSGISENDRIQLLIVQADHSIVPPFELLKLGPGNLVDGARRAEAERVFRELRSIPPATAREERSLYFVGLFLAEYYQMCGELSMEHSTLQAALESSSTQPFRQLLKCAIARNVAWQGELDAAEDWLDRCDSRPTDLHMDSAYRIARSFIATLRQDFEGVLRELGDDASGVTFAKGQAPLAILLRANALETSGRVDAAVSQLVAVTRLSGGLTALEIEVLKHRALDLCPRSLRQARARVSFVNRSVLRLPLLCLGPLGAGVVVGGASLAMAANDSLEVQSAAMLTVALALLIVGAIFVIVKFRAGPLRHLEELRSRAST